jgi:hypothetical protein
MNSRGSLKSTLKAIFKQTGKSTWNGYIFICIWPTKIEPIWY